MANQRNREAGQDATTAGAFASAAMTDIGRTLGNNVPEHAAKIGAKLNTGSGFDQVRNYHALIGSAFIFFVGGWYGIHALPKDWGGIFMLVFALAGSAIAFGIAVSLAFQFHRYSAVRLRARLWPVTKPDVNAGTTVTGNVLTDAIFVAPIKLALFAILIPLWTIGAALEVLRVISLSAKGNKHVAYRGDEGKYYDRVRKEYAKRYSANGEGAALEYLRLAYSGLLTPIGEEIPPKGWSNGGYKQWLAPMIERHGPVNQYCAGRPGTATTEVDSGGKLPEKYSAI
ncbi:hypothetical protein [Marinobacter nauticus]|uniref:Uncharacterized protein n=1 Tax=Marinobacter nauticus (strain ATCC 700491 / DSM 11845 / VT8) TaxID=351348 RepID=A1U808_MARN8|nr:hypothetical protein [Marinobacter nauticus]ABM21127.1 hypothetical protein Maqu_4276 [Marinobacter nauticus VT8]